MQTVTDQNSEVAADTVSQELPRKLGSTALAQIKRAVDEFEQDGRHDDAIEYLMAALAAVLHRSGELELLMAKLRRDHAGKRSERIDTEQLGLMLELLKTASEQPIDPEALAREDAVLTSEIETAEREAPPLPKERRNSWRTNKDVKRELHNHAVPEEDKKCNQCGRDRKLMGHDCREMLDYVPAHFVVVEHQVEKYACGYCKDGVITATLPAGLPGNRSATDALLAQVVVSKYADHVPLTRMNSIFARSGVEIPLSTMTDWVATVADSVSPIVTALEARVKESYVIGTDATGLKVLDPGSAENIERGTIWCYVGDGWDVVLKYAPTGEGVGGPREFFAGRTGYVQADAASVFDRIFNGSITSAKEVGCWAHARRRFVALSETDARVAYPLQLIARLYRIEHLADARGLSPKDRALMRMERTVPVLDKIKQSLIITMKSEPPGSDLAKAARYVLNHWDALNRFTGDGQLRLDNNITEQELRSVAVGRRNYLFAGSHDAARRAAVLYSIMRSCARQHVAPLPYLTDVLRRLRDGTPVADLLPDRWQQIYGATAAR